MFGNAGPRSVLQGQGCDEDRTECEEYLLVEMGKSTKLGKQFQSPHVGGQNFHCRLLGGVVPSPRADASESALMYVMLKSRVCGKKIPSLP